MPLGSADTARPHLLPAALTEKLATWLAHAVAALAGGVAIFGWISLLTWSAGDPSFSQGTSGPVANLLGIWGATVADALLQLLGAASVIVLLFAMFCSAELALAKEIERWPARLCLAPIAVLAAAGAFSALPKVASWSIHHGYGGVAGDLVFSICASVLAFPSPIGAQILSGVVLGTASAAALAYSLGVWPAEAVEELRARIGVPSAARTWGAIFATTWRREQPRIEPTLRPVSGPDASSREPSRESPRAPFPSFGGHPDPTRDATSAAPGPRDVDPIFEAETEQAGYIAQRFAPEPPREKFGLRRARRQPYQSEPIKAAIRAWRTPDITLLPKGIAPAAAPAGARSSTAALEAALSEFGIQCTVRSATIGPVVTSYELSPASAAKCERIIGLAGDISRAIGSDAGRAFVLPGKEAVIMEIPNAQPADIRLRDVLESAGKNSSRLTLPLSLGLSPGGHAFAIDLDRAGHVLVAGAARSGKSMRLHALILSLVYRLSPDECRFAMIDSSAGAFSVYGGLPHLAAAVATEPRDAISLLQWALAEIPERRKIMAQLGTNTIRRYNELVMTATQQGQPPSLAVQVGFDANTDEAIFERKRFTPALMPRIVIIIDDLTSLLTADRRSTALAIARLLQEGADTGLHVIAATQYPEGRMSFAQLERSFPCRAALKAPTRLASRTILGEDGAEQLLDRGDMLMVIGGQAPTRVHGSLVTRDEVLAVVQSLREQGHPDYLVPHPG